MPTTLISNHFLLILHPETGKFDLQSASANLVALSGCQMKIEISQPGSKITLPLDHWDIHAPIGESPDMGGHGETLSLQVEQTLPHPSLKVTVTFALSQDHPLFLWKIRLENASGEAIRIDKIEFLRVGGQDKFGSLDFPPDPQWSFYSNGWQSWSPTGAFPNGQPMRISRLGFLQQPMIINPGTPVLRMPGYYTADFFGALADLKSKVGLIAGFLSQKQHFGTIEAVLYDRPSLAMWTSDGARLDPEKVIESDWAVITPFSTNDPDPLREYLEAVAREHSVTREKIRPTPTGWCSWYQYYTRLSAQDVQANLTALTTSRARLPLELVQIDDGFETKVGDWFSFTPGFPDGIAPLAREISAHGCTPGLWLAPFIVHPGSEFARKNPQFILRNKHGKPVNAGFGWNTLATGLDLTFPGALEAACVPVRAAVAEWGFPYLKLDFLYAAALPGLHHDPTRTRAQIMRQGIETIRAAAGTQAYLVGCGLPLGSGIGLVDAMRIGADVNSSWEPEIKGIRVPFKNEPAVPSARNSLHNILTRAPLHNRWWVNDPDCLLVRPDTWLTLAEIQSLATAIGVTGGSLLISDDLAALPTDRLRVAQVLLPVVGQRTEVLDLIAETAPTRLRLPLTGAQGKWTVIAKFNWKNTAQAWEFKPSEFSLPGQSCWVSSFWDEKIFHYAPGIALNMPAIPAHGAVLAAVIPFMDDSAPLYLGSNLHFSQGCEIAEWAPEPQRLRFSVELGRQGEGFVQLYLPSVPTHAECEGKPLEWQELGGGAFRFILTVDRTAQIEMIWGDHHAEWM
ncbi:MAG: glycoside hydrolase family 36 protein [Bellilinea sp.]